MPTVATTARPSSRVLAEHLGEPGQEGYGLLEYLSIGELHGCSDPAVVYQEAMEAIFQRHEPCYRLPQLRWSKRHPGKHRWVLYEMWPLDDPVTGTLAVLVTEQNISQVKAVEEQYREQMMRLEARLAEALAAACAAAGGAGNQGWTGTAALEIDTPAERTLRLLEGLLSGRGVTTEEAEELREAILQVRR